MSRLDEVTTEPLAEILRLSDSGLVDLHKQLIANIGGDFIDDGGHLAACHSCSSLVAIRELIAIRKATAILAGRFETERRPNE